MQVNQHNFLSVQLAKDINKATRVEWSKMTDEEGNIRYTITLEQPRDPMNLDSILLHNHKKCESSTR